MILGRYCLDGTPYEEVNPEGKKRVFELEVCIIQHPRRYPIYKVESQTVALCESKDEAEVIMKEIIDSGEYLLNDIYCFYIYERLLSVRFYRSECMSCWLYGANGQLIDKRTFPTYLALNGFEGRSEDEVRFKFGDFAELYASDEVELVYVLAPPQGKEHYAKKSEEYGKPYYGDISDDSYIVINGPSYLYHMHIDALQLFKPHFPIPKSVIAKYQKIWEGYLQDRVECYGPNPTIYQI